MFAEEKPALLPLPLELFRYYQHGKRGVNLDGCVEVDAAYYGLPPGWIGREVYVQWDQLYVRILDPKNRTAARARAAETWLGSHKKRRPSKQMPLQVSQCGEFGSTALVIRSALDVRTFALPIQRIVQQIGPELAVMDILTMSQIIGRGTLEASFDATLLL